MKELIRLITSERKGLLKDNFLCAHRALRELGQQQVQMTMGAPLHQQQHHQQTTHQHLQQQKHTVGLLSLGGDDSDSDHLQVVSTPPRLQIANTGCGDERGLGDGSSSGGQID